MQILVIGSGGREHALVKGVKRSQKANKIFVWPGSDGMLSEAERVPVPSGDLVGLATWARNMKIDLAIIGPEAELVAGLSDELRERGIATFGPSKSAARLEGSKIFSKLFMQEFNIPTARFDVVSTVQDAISVAQKYKAPYVLKADGLAAGKGVFICKTLSELKDAAAGIFEQKKLGDAGLTALIEEFQPGKELSYLILTNGEDFVPLPACRDHKRLQDGDLGPNTGGMGVVGPIELAKELVQEIQDRIVLPTLKGLRERRLLYRGTLFIGIMLTENGPQVLEYNTRFGDPETQVIVPLLEGDWAEVLSEVASGKLPKIKWKKKYSACVVMAAEGYPEHPVKGVSIHGDLDTESNETHVLHAGTRLENGGFVTNGGRVLNVVSLGESLKGAIGLAYQRVETISWPGVQFRRDIGESTQ